MRLTHVRFTVRRLIAVVAALSALLVGLSFWTSVLHPRQQHVECTAKSRIESSGSLTSVPRASVRANGLTAFT
jgi:hypothetical protein